MVIKMAKHSYYEQKFKELKDECKERGITVKLVNDYKTRDYLGMNPEAAKSIGYPIPNNTIYVDRQMNWRDRYGTLVHEVIEYKLMNKGDSYWKAHCKALDAESRPSYD